MPCVRSGGLSTRRHTPRHGMATVVVHADTVPDIPGPQREGCSCDPTDQQRRSGLDRQTARRRALWKCLGAGRTASPGPRTCTSSPVPPSTARYSSDLSAGLNIVPPALPPFRVFHSLRAMRTSKQRPVQCVWHSRCVQQRGSTSSLPRPVRPSL